MVAWSKRSLLFALMRTTNPGSLDALCRTCYSNSFHFPLQKQSTINHLAANIRNVNFNGTCGAIIKLLLLLSKSSKTTKTKEKWFGFSSGVRMRGVSPATNLVCQKLDSTFRTIWPMQCNQNWNCLNIDPTRTISDAYKNYCRKNSIS